jgi:hypothetical protein
MAVAKTKKKLKREMLGAVATVSLIRSVVDSGDAYGSIRKSISVAVVVATSMM